VIFSRDFFTELTSARASAVFPESWPVFAGHFPGRPIVPAYALVGLVLAHAEHALGPLSLTGIDRMKLARPLGPGASVVSELATERQGETVKLRASLSAEGELVGTLVLSARQGA
jgi:3-hydroxyacyl-[acyl-carrier-protein] dehydratase